MTNYTRTELHQVLWGDESRFEVYEMRAGQRYNAVYICTAR